MTQIDTLLKEIAAREARFSGKLRGAASEECLRKLTGSSKDAFNYDVDQEYLDFLSRCDGIDNNGYVIYSSGCLPGKIESFVDANRLWREGGHNKDTVFFAESGSYLFGFAAGKFFQQDRYSRDEIENFGSCKELIVDVLDRILNE